MSTRIPILRLQLLDLPIPAGPGNKQLLLTGAKDLLRAHQERCDEVGVDLQLFHNKEVIYSGIQLSKYQTGSEWTAIGSECVNALKLWYQLFQETHPVELEHVVELREYYTPTFLPYYRHYQLNKLLISDTLAKELNDMEDRFREEERIERYLYGNLMTFFQFIGFQFDKEVHFLKVRIEEMHRYGRALSVFHGQKKTALQIRFKCNFRLPQILRLGQSTALGFGRLITLSSSKKMKYTNNHKNI